MTEKMYPEDEISLEELLLPLKKRWKMILLVSIIVAAIAAAYSLTLPKIYEAEAIIEIGLIGRTPLETIPQIKAVMTSDPLVSEILKGLSIEPTVKNIKKFSKRIEYKDKNGLLNIVASELTPEDALKLAETATKKLIQRHSQIQKNLQEENIKIWQELKTSIKPLTLSISSEEFRGSPTTIKVEPYTDGLPKKPKKKQIVLVAFLVGAMISTFYSYILEYKNKRSPTT